MIRINKYIVVLVTLFASLNLYAQQTTRLSANWEFVKQDLGGVWEAVRPVAKGSPESVPVWTKVELPHCVNATDAVDPDVPYYQGPSWYRTQLQVNNPYEGGRTLLHFEGAGQKSEVYIYTTKVAEHIGGYDEWTVDITNAIDSFKRSDAFLKQFGGKIPVSIRTDNSRDLEMIPSDLSDFNLYGGIYRHVNLVYVPKLSIEKIFITPQVDAKGKEAKVNIKFRWYNPSHQTGETVIIKLTDPNGKILLEQEKKLTSLNEQSTVAELKISSPKLWSPATPYLYSLSISSKSADAYTAVQKFGVRHFEFIKQGPFLLNGERLLLKGTQRHEDHAGVAAALTDEMVRNEFRLMKEMGVNFIRLGHFQNSRLALDLCDSLGILVWEEIPWCRGGLGGEKYRQQAKQMLVNMIEQHYNHPSVIIWGLGNENDWPGDFTSFDTLAIRSFMTELNTLAHQLDSNRKTAIRRCDFCKDIVDVYSPSIWAGWYRGVYTDYKEISQREFLRVDHFLHAEWGGDSHAHRYSENPDNALLKVKRSTSADERSGDATFYGGAARISKDGDWSESYICNLFDWHLKEQETMPWLTGSSQWIFKDFSTPIRPENPVPYVNQKGVLERDFTKKDGYYVFQSYWSTKPMVHIFGQNMPVRWGTEGETKMIKVYSNCDEAELFVNGKSLGSKKRNSQDFPAAGLRWELPMYKGNYNIHVVAKKGSTIVKDSLQFSYESQAWEKPHKMILSKIKEENDVVTVEVKLFDSKGIQCLDASNWVRFGITGDGNLIDNLGTSTASRLVQLYNGRAIISIRKNKGVTVMSARIDNIPTAFLNIE